jgi:hypothetical protein
MDTAKLASISGKDKLKGDLDWYHASETITPILPAMVNANIRTQQMGVQQGAPAAAAGARNEADRAAQGPRFGGARYNFGAAPSGE